MPSLLEQFFTRIDGSQEDIASEGIAYILNSSATARESLKAFIYHSVGVSYENIGYITQSVGENKERPDICGLDENGNEVIIIETKFWSSLTDNQPTEYLKRLKADSVLIFVCPRLRKISLSSEIEHKMITDGVKYDKNDSFYKTKKDVFVFITDWFYILETMKTALVSNGERALVSDIDQLIGFCEVIDNNAFLPVRNKDLSPEIAIRINSYRDLLEKIYDKLRPLFDVKKGDANSQSLKYGYQHYFTINKYGVILDYDTKKWELIADTPFWVTIAYPQKGFWPQTEELQLRLKKIAIKLSLEIFPSGYNNRLCFAIKPRINVMEDKVIEDFVNTIKAILTELDR